MRFFTGLACPFSNEFASIWAHALAARGAETRAGRVPRRADRVLGEAYALRRFVAPAIVEHGASALRGGCRARSLAASVVSWLGSLVNQPVQPFRGNRCPRGIGARLSEWRRRLKPTSNVRFTSCSVDAERAGRHRPCYKLSRLVPYCARFGPEVPEKLKLGKTSWAGIFDPLRFALTRCSSSKYLNGSNSCTYG